MFNSIFSISVALALAFTASGVSAGTTNALITVNPMQEMIKRNAEQSRKAQQKLMERVTEYENISGARPPHPSKNPEARLEESSFNALGISKDAKPAPQLEPRTANKP